MSKINVLDKTLANRISAGEVVEKPASVVKELVENSIDAKASNITIEIQGGGIRKIVISDNGSGIQKEDVKKAFLPHATSKIKTLDDLDAISSLGFRGEALASIAAVSQVEMTTKTQDESIGTRVLLSGGEIEREEDFSCNTGTTIEINNLFYNTPARKKFLRKPKMEERDITEVIEKFLLAKPEIRIKYIVDDKIIFNTMGSCLKDNIYTIYGKETAENLIEINENLGDIEISGYIGKPLIARPNRTYQTLLINGRIVKNFMVSNAISTAYENYLMKGKFPFYVLNLKCAYNSVDVNIHPTKQEVKFENPNQIYGAFHTIVLNALLDVNYIQEIKDEFGEHHKNQANVVNGSDQEPLPHETQKGKNFAQPRGDGITYLSDIFEAEEKAWREKHCPNPYKDDFLSIEEVCVFPDAPRARFKSFSLRRIEQDENFKRHKTILSFSSSHRYTSDFPGINSLDFGYDTSFMEKIHKKSQSSSDQKAIIKKRSSRKDINKKSSESEKIEVKSQVQELKSHTEQSISNVIEKFVRNRQEETMQTQKYEQSKVFDDKEKIEIIGTVFKTYILVQKTNALYLIDQHAGHERNLYDKYISQIRSEHIQIQDLMIPYVFECSAEEYIFFWDNRESFEKLGFKFDLVDDKHICLKSIPFLVFNISLDAFITTLKSNIGFFAKEKEDLVKDFVAQQACKHAVKAGDELSINEIEKFIHSLNENQVLLCPHGRPIILEIKKSQIEKWFKRIV